MRKKRWNADLRSLRSVGQDARPAGMEMGYGIRRPAGGIQGNMPTTLLTIDLVRAIFDPVEIVLLFAPFDAPSRFGASMSLYR